MSENIFRRSDKTTSLVILNKSLDIFVNHQQCAMGQCLLVNILIGVYGFCCIALSRWFDLYCVMNIMSGGGRCQAQVACHCLDLSFSCFPRPVPFSVSTTLFTRNGAWSRVVETRKQQYMQWQATVVSTETCHHQLIRHDTHLVSRTRRIIF